MRYIILLAIILIAAYMIIPNIKYIQLHQEELVMVENLRDFNDANSAFRKAQGKGAFADSIETLIAPPTGPKYLDETWRKSQRHHFRLIYSGGGTLSPNTYSLLALPEFKRRISISSFCIDQKGIVFKTDKDELTLEAGTDGCRGGIPVAG
ncbi:MAG: hypothetical protein PHN49_04970 [Candidatus Omnitrophica bacterium]|nr:hypothetical protein [Candidatus Omnitrophota bacterium]MDD5670973.1 hypothetical protein [Candidatus Omnitrophota bacterium]